MNAPFLLRNGWKAVQSAWTVRALTNPERRALLFGSWYSLIVYAQNQIPLNATIRFVSPAPPWYLVYHLYPRLLKPGAEKLSETAVVRRRYPHDWVLAYSEPPEPIFKIYPPRAAS